MENPSIFKIVLPQLGDEIALAPMHIKSWKETYVNSESGLTEEMVNEMLGDMLTNTDFRKNTILESLKNPDTVLYRVVKNNTDEIVGFMHCSKNNEYNEFEGIYLLNEVKGFGIGGKLMEEFLGWADKNKPSQLTVFTFNDKAIRFYTKYGFVKTDKPVQLYKDKLPFIEMVRPIDNIIEE